MTTTLRIFGILVLAYLVSFTGSKLMKMAKIRGFISGPAPQSKKITDKAVLPGEYGDAYWLAWDSADIRVPGHSRVNLPLGVWAKFAVGEEIEVFYFSGDRWPYTRENTYASNENFGFDVAFLVAWLVGICALVHFQIRHARQMRFQRPPPLPNSA